MNRRGLVMWMLAATYGAVCATGMAAAQTTTFRAAKIFPLPGLPEGATGLAALADVGGPSGQPDGILDLLNANQTPTLTVLFGKGDGTFTNGGTLNLGTTPTAMAVGDVNNDHLVDVLIGDNSSTITVYLGQRNAPDGTLFQAVGSPIPAGPTPRGIAIADVDHDGKPDLVVADEGAPSGELRVLLGNGDGTFTESIDSFCADSPTLACQVTADCVAAGHVGPCNSMGVRTGRESSAVVVADFTGDGKLDAAVCNEFSNDVTVLQGDGTGGFTFKQTIPVGDAPNAIAAADLNGDHRLDLVVANGNSDNVAVLLGRPDGTFAAASFYSAGATACSPRALALADVNLDGNLDAIVANNFSFDAAVLLGNGMGGFAAPRLFVTGAEPIGVVAGDLNMDGAVDVVGINRDDVGPTAAVLLSRADGSFVGVENVVADANPSGVTVGDVNNDGLSDLLVSNTGTQSTPGTVRVIPASIAGGFGDSVSLQAAGDAAAVGAGDFNGDGILDVAVVNRSTSNVSVFLGSGRGGYLPVQNYSLGAVRNCTPGNGATCPTAIVVGDWNRDGRSDLAVVQQESGATGSVQILMATANGDFTQPAAIAVDQLPVSIATGDFNNDGHPDLVVVNSASNNLSILLGNGNGTFLKPTTVAVAGGPKSVTVADFDRDGNDDLAVATITGSTVALLFGNGQGRFPEVGRALSVSGSPSMVTARDVTGDGIPDILVGDEVSNVIRVFVRAAAPNVRVFQSADVVGVNRRPIAVIAADVDGDGRYDCVTANESPAPTASVLTNIRGAGGLRGDANGDGRVSAADAVAVMRELGDGTYTRVEDVAVHGTYAAAPGVDANGDGLVTPQDARAVAFRVFNPPIVGL